MMAVVFLFFKISEICDRFALNRTEVSYIDMSKSDVGKVQFASPVEGKRMSETKWTKIY